ncbi:hypothetical protein [Saccharothrix syringae]|uniref:Uncharacterized protein n=1 Tax=Saccharothrix syringae TaxID=103733 RepID=A0A5Q0H7Q8_SACSY|nr:hypothetical protein [Saccharothrix syringae]QFZ22219.1 hypothetical protein EKG83_36685 [Saccharothrix syringae]
MSDRRNAIACALVVSTALGAFLALRAVLVPPVPVDDARAVAAAVLTAARGADAGGVVGAVDRVLPGEARAVVVRPARPGEPPARPGRPPGREADHRVVVVVGDLDRAAVASLAADGGVIGSATTPDGWWAAVSVPAAGPARVGPALALLVAAALLGAAATEVPHRTTRRREALVRGLAGVVADLPEDVAARVREVLAVRAVVPDGLPVDDRHHHVVATEATGDPALVDTVARTLRPGCADGHRLVVRPEVVVYVRAVRTPPQ